MSLKLSSEIIVRMQPFGYEWWGTASWLQWVSEPHGCVPSLALFPSPFGYEWWGDTFLTPGREWVNLKGMSHLSPFGYGGDSFLTPGSEWVNLKGVPSLSSSSGLRTLCIAKTDISDEVYDEWKHTYYKASTSIRDREKKIQEAAELIEQVRLPFILIFILIVIVILILILILILIWVAQSVECRTGDPKDRGSNSVWSTRKMCEFSRVKNIVLTRCQCVRERCRSDCHVIMFDIPLQRLPLDLLC